MSQKNSKPNIIFILSDQQRWDTVGCYGQLLEVTPNLDRMAEEGARFTHTFSLSAGLRPGPFHFANRKISDGNRLFS